ncbi:MAG TPA: trypsin-like peptidase domain-containing protein [Gaiellaceae bacterium]|nr:trypsin-like peptidase domain-containing protein [Gaiellaceae bacterium]
MPSLPSWQAFAALAAAAALGAAAAVGAVAALGELGGTTTVVRETVVEPASSSPPRTGAMTINEIYERAAPGVVQITAAGPRGLSLPVDASALGSGFVVDKAGHIVTNFHVIEGADEIRVSFSNRDTVEAEVVGVDRSTDLAVLRVDVPASALTPLSLGDSDTVRVGEQVVAIGNPFGLDRTVTAGIVSAVQRLIQGPAGFVIDHVIQTDAPINKGNSGGPLLNMRGQVIGVNTQIETGGLSQGNVGIGFAVPSNTVKDVLAQILRTGRAEHAFLGIQGQSITKDLVETFNLPVDAGVLVVEVTRDSGAQKAGLRPGDTEVVVAGETYTLGGDIIVSADGKRVTSIEELRAIISEHDPGDRIELEIVRDGKRKTVTVTLGRRPELAPRG